MTNEQTKQNLAQVFTMARDYVVRNHPQDEQQLLGLINFKQQLFTKLDKWESLEAEQAEKDDKKEPVKKA